MAGILKAMLRNPHLPPELGQPGGWPAAMQAEWSDDEGTKAAAEHRDLLVAEFRKIRAALDDFKPDLVLIWGDDQYENFREDVIPPYCICAYDSFEFGMPSGNLWGDTETRIKLPGHRQAGKKLADYLIRNGFDTAYSYKPLHDPLGHAFTNGIIYLDYDRQGFDYPVLPFAINCYGRRVIVQKGGRPDFERSLTDDELDPSAPTPARLFDLGAATARFFQESPWRVAILSSSSWSHAFLTPKTHYLYPDTDADLVLYEALRTGDYGVWRDYSPEAVEESGQQEVLNWMCLAGALSELGRVPAHTSFVETWIFNSSKCFLISPPA
ncbi:hypothetical protein ACFOMD_01490 [Sphingoaurantiacus capsulatus]|uniref:Extradiol ring-cleavage dioxygenase class III enzyme subunit B domain-containing protein n=1 Tax=Sphingoaurantiacus capsulatus TaxID=1771310 RepID=A0ABV7X4Y9_9SPHN